MFAWYKRLFALQVGTKGSKDLEVNALETLALAEENENIPVNQAPPGYEWMAGFGYKVNWYMIPEYELKDKGWTIQNLADAIGLQNQQKMSWNDGVEFGYKSLSSNESQVYISSPFDGWVFIINEADEKLDLLDDVVANYYAFGSYRVVDYVGWKYVQDNKVVRYFVFSCGDIWKNIGDQTVDESCLNFVDLSGLDTDDAIDKICSDDIVDNENIISIFDEDHVIEICKAWTGVNPCDFDAQSVPIEKLPSLGIGGRLIKA
ncbi:hypothetical protein [Psychrobacter lutiphocae]|uniref:hypothetical protein n=1 Tax=Psychrobacter lutiphocae TaxID=540500 RepID=UPI00036F84C0|nr:hypothetical protein [Psychrobacter lutiphocae]